MPPASKRVPALCLADGVTGWVDAGSQGADHIGDTIAVARSSPQQGRVLINIGRAGILPEGDTMDLARADVAAAKDAIAKNRDFIVGVKARLSRDVAGPNDVEVMKRTQEVATAFNLPVMIHMGQTISPLPAIINQLKRGDIVTHMFAPPPNSIIDDSGHILPEVLAARRRGVWFDVGNGMTGHMRWDTVRAIMQTGFWPDSFSTDWNINAHMTGVIDLPNCMSKFLGLGMSVDQVIARATVNPSRMFPLFNDRGTLNVGAPADVAVLELRDGNFRFPRQFQQQDTGQAAALPERHRARRQARAARIEVLAKRKERMALSRHPLFFNEIRCALSPAALPSESRCRGCFRPIARCARRRSSRALCWWTPASDR